MSRDLIRCDGCGAVYRIQERLGLGSKRKRITSNVVSKLPIVWRQRNKNGRGGEKNVKRAKNLLAKALKRVIVFANNRGLFAEVNPGAKIAPGTRLSGWSLIDEDVTIEEGVILSNHVTLLSHSSVGGTYVKRPTLIKRGAFIGYGAIILMGSTIGENAVVGAGAVVTQNTNVPDGETWAGVPARNIRGRRT